MGQTPKGQLKWENNCYKKKIFFFFSESCIITRFFDFFFLSLFVWPHATSTILVQVKRNKVGLEYLENVLKEWGRWGMLSHRITYKRNRQDHKEKMRGNTIYGKVSGENR